MPKYQHLDDSEAIFFERQLESVKAQTYDRKYPNLKARELIPVSFSAGEGAESITWYEYDHTGIAKIMRGYANNLPRVDIKGRKNTSPVHQIVDAYGYNYVEVKKAAQAGLALETRRSNAARREALFLENQIAFFGDSDFGLPGFFNNALIPIAAVAADGAGGLTTFASKAPDLIIRDVNELINDVITNTNGVETPNTVLLPISTYTLLNTTPRSSTSDTTIMQFLKVNHPEITRWEWMHELETAGTGSTRMMVAYVRDPDHLTLEVPMDFRQLEVQVKGLEYEVPCIQSIGGTIVYYPLSANFAYGI